MTAKHPKTTTHSTRVLTPRVLLLCLFLIPLNAWWVIETEFVRYSDNVTTQSLFFNATSALLLLVAANAVLRRVRPAWVFTPPEMTAVYVVVVVASGLAGHDTLQVLFTTIAYPVKRAAAMYDGGSSLLAVLPERLVVTDPAALQNLYAGHSSLYRPENLRPWLGPLALWTGFVMLLVWTMLCLTAIFRRPWENERLAYPVAEIPLEVIGDGERRPVLRAPLFWAGAGIGATLQIVNLLHGLYPWFPGVAVGVQYYKPEQFPWSAAGQIPLCTYAFAYGLTFLIPTQIGFSCWFFFLLSRVELVTAAVYGYTEVGKFPYIQQQGVGAILGVFATLILTARTHLRDVWRAATGGPPMDDADEPMPYRVAFWGLAAGVVGMGGFLVWAGMRPGTALLYLGILLCIVVVVARLRAELGLPTFELYQVGADQILPTVAGTRALTNADYAVLTLGFFTLRTHRQFPMQSHVDAMHIARRTGTPLRPLTALILAASLLGTVCAFWAMLHATYEVGLESARFQGPAVWAFGKAPWQRWENWTRYPVPPDAGAIQAYGFGAGFALLLGVLRARFVWWPFHPAGYLVSGSFGLFRLWLPLFVSWLVKVLLLRFGGLPAYRAALPFFYGLVLGEFTAGFLRTVLDLACGLYLPAGSGIGGL